MERQVDPDGCAYDEQLAQFLAGDEWVARFGSERNAGLPPRAIGRAKQPAWLRMRDPCRPPDTRETVALSEMKIALVMMA
jgi:hypothetical protein